MTSLFKIPRNCNSLIIDPGLTSFPSNVIARLLSFSFENLLETIPALLVISIELNVCSPLSYLTYLLELCVVIAL